MNSFSKFSVTVKQMQQREEMEDEETRFDKFKIIVKDYEKEEEQTLFDSFRVIVPMYRGSSPEPENNNAM